MTILRTLAALSLASAAMSLTGCMLSAVPPASSTSAEPAVITGSVHGGQSPVTGARIFLFEAASTGYGKPAISDILQASGTLDTTYNAYYVTTDSTGSFGLTGKYTCTPGAQVYLLATQGNPGLAAGKNNPALAEMAALGACPSGGALSSALTIRVSEVTTVAAVYALAGYMTAPNAVSRAGTALAATGLANAFATSANLANLTSGLAYLASPSNAGSTPGIFYAYESQGTVPQAMMYTMANILAACVNSDGSTSTTTNGSTTLTGCGTLFANATADGTATGTQPTDTVTALLNIVHHPAANVSTLYNLSTTNAPYQPTLTFVPSDFNLKVAFTLSCSGCNTTLNPSYKIAVDASGNLVIPANDANGNQIVMILSNLGTGQSTTGAYGSTAYSTGLAQGYVIDQSGNAWAGGLKNTSSTPQLDKLAVPGGSDTRFNLTTPAAAVAIDASGNIYATTSTGVTVFNASGTIIANPAQGQAWTGATVDAASNLYTIAGGSNSVYLNNTAYTGGGLSTPLGMALDSNNSVWVTNNNSSLSKFSLTGSPAILTAVSPATGYTGGGLNFASGREIVPPVPAMDGASNVWVPGSSTGLAEFSNAGVAISPSPGYSGVCSYPNGTAVDGSGNVWVTCSNTNFSYGASMYELVGAAVPVATPILPSQLGVRP